MAKKTVFIILMSLIGFKGLACTNFLVGRAASADGSTFISYSADSYFLFGALYHYPAANHPKDTYLNIKEWDTGKPLGKIKQVEQTYSVIGNMNEFQLCIGETTFGGRAELVDTTGIMDYGSLIYVTLQRAKNAREAIKIMTNLVAEYGYYSSGESFSIADPNEVWVMEMVGKGTNNKGAVWVAQRIPDDCVSAHANHARITTFPLDDPQNCVYADDVIAFAREKGLFNGKNKDFNFSDTYAPIDYGALRFCEARVWSFFRKVNPDMDKYITYIKGKTDERMPLWVKPSSKLNVQLLQEYMRDQYEGTEFDITKGIAAGPFGSKLRCSPLTFKVDTLEYAHERPTATQQTGFTFVAQMRNWLPNHIGGILWFGVDDAASNVYVPMYCGITSIPECFKEDNGSLLEYSPTSAFWTFNWVANYAYSKYSYMIQDIKKTQSSIEKNFQLLVPSIDKIALGMREKDAKKFLTEFSATQAENTTNAWKKLGEYLLVKYMDGNIKKENENGFLQNTSKIPPTILRPGYPTEYLKKIITENPDCRLLTEEELKQRQ